MPRSLEERVAALEAAVEALKPVELGDLSSEFNNMRVHRCPPKWIDSGGPDYTGSRLSETTPEFCDALSSFLSWRAGKEEQEAKTYLSKKTGEQLPVAPLTRRDAARAKAWGKRLREAGPAITKTRGVAVQRSLGDYDDGTDLPF